jgi:hypothetical protein
MLATYKEATVNAPVINPDLKPHSAPNPNRIIKIQSKKFIYNPRLK